MTWVVMRGVGRSRADRIGIVDVYRDCDQALHTRRVRYPSHLAVAMVGCPRRRDECETCTPGSDPMSRVACWI